jgi:hypothetical protein
MMLASLLAAGLTLPAYAAERLQLIEQQIEAGLIYNFLKYTQWPAERSARTDVPIVVCLFGGDPFSGHLQPMAGRTVNAQKIEVRSVTRAADIGGCSLLFIHGDQKPNWPELQRTLAGKSVLTVSDFEGFAVSGGMIEFTQLDSRIGVLINTAAVTAAHLEVQDRLLKLARTVTPAAPGR